MDVCSTGEVVHFIVQDDPIGSHDIRAPEQVDSYAKDQCSIRSSDDTGKWLTRGERNNVTPLIGSYQMGGASIVQDDIIRWVVLRSQKSIPEKLEALKGESTYERSGISRAVIDFRPNALDRRLLEEFAREWMDVSMRRRMPTHNKPTVQVRRR